jgi:predicted deacylase
VRTVDIETWSWADTPPGTSERLWVRALDLLAGPALLPAFMVAGSEPGPTFLVVAGVHGDEYEGMAAIRQVVPTLDPAAMRGRFVAFPVANPFAYEARARIAPLHLDGLNLARVFPGDPAGSPSRLLAHRLLGLVERHLGPDDLFLDFHSGSADVEYARVIGFRDVPGSHTERAEEIARYGGIDRLWRIPASPGPFNAETALRGYVTLGTETTGRAGCQPEDVAAYATLLRNLLTYLGITPNGPPPPRFAGPARPTTDIVSPATGFFNATKRLSDDVTAGEPLGTIVDLFGDPVAEIAVPISGTVWAMRATPPVRVGELIASIATEGAGDGG